MRILGSDVERLQVSLVEARDQQHAALRIVAVEAEPSHGSRLRAVIAEGSSAELVSFREISLALAELATREADCLLLGATARDPEGIEALRALREAGVETPVVVLAASADRQSVTRAVEGGAQDLLLKGQFDERLLMRSIDYAIDRRMVEMELTRQALHDGLTGLPNRALFMDRLGRALTELEFPGETHAVLLLDIDRFRVINDSLGPDLGDRLLLMISERIAATLTDCDFAARFGGDEFAVLCQGIEDSRAATDLARRIEHALSAPFLLADEPVFIRCSAGISLASEHSTSDSMLRDADSAMNSAKERGGGTHQVFAGHLHEHAMRRLKVEHSLHGALRRKELVLRYQPQFRLDDGAIYGMEALVRWNHPVRGLVGPSEFIGAAEETGLVVELGAWVLEQACQQALRWPLEMSVNVAARQCVQPGFVGQVDHVLRTTGIDPSSLCLELTETAPIREDGVAHRVLTELKARGIKLAVDDFGCGYSSLQALRTLPFDVMKIDRSFVEMIHESRRDAAAARALIDLGHAFGMTIVAEGVERPEQAQMLLDMGCDFAQGFHLGKPSLPADLEARFDLSV